MALITFKNYYYHHKLNMAVMVLIEHWRRLLLIPRLVQMEILPYTVCKII